MSSQRCAFLCVVLAFYSRQLMVLAFYSRQLMVLVFYSRQLMVLAFYSRQLMVVLGYRQGLSLVLLTMWWTYGLNFFFFLVFNDGHTKISNQ